MGEVKRSVRVAARVQEELASMLSRDVKDPRVVGVVISRVLMTDDLRQARVFVRVLEEDKRDEALKGLAKASAMLRSGVGKRAKLRYAPELEFRYDEGQDAALRIEQLLHEIGQDRARKP